MLLNPPLRQAAKRCTQPYLKIPTPRQFQDIQGENPNHPPHIAAHLQGTQNPPHRSQPCKRAAIANTRQTAFGSTDNHNLYVNLQTTLWWTNNMKLYIKNMVCSRCKMVVKAQLENRGLRPLSVNLGEVEIEGDLSKEQLAQLDTSLKSLGFELIDDKKSQTIEKIKNTIVTLVHHTDHDIKTNLSSFITSQIHQDYNYLSNLFSEVEGTTIEKYFIAQRIERVKELIVYDELTLSEIADQMGYSSVAYLSNQFKKITGFTPSYFKSLKEYKRKNIEEL